MATTRRKAPATAPETVSELPPAEERDWSKATSAEIAAEVLRVFPGSYISGSRLVDPAECHDAE
jgi:hypothetical protein